MMATWPDESRAPDIVDHHPTWVNGTLKWIALVWHYPAVNRFKLTASSFR